MGLVKKAFCENYSRYTILYTKDIKKNVAEKRQPSFVAIEAVSYTFAILISRL
jgi:hypothetical protein